MISKCYFYVSELIFSACVILKKTFREALGQNKGYLSAEDS